MFTLGHRWGHSQGVGGDPTRVISNLNTRFSQVFRLSGLAVYVFSYHFPLNFSHWVAVSARNIWITGFVVSRAWFFGMNENGSLISGVSAAPDSGPTWLGCHSWILKFKFTEPDNDLPALALGTRSLLLSLVISNWFFLLSSSAFTAEAWVIQAKYPKITILKEKIESFKLPSVYAVHQLQVGHFPSGLRFQSLNAQFLQALGTISLGVGVCTDVVTAGALCFFLNRLRTGLKSWD